MCSWMEDGDPGQRTGTGGGGQGPRTRDWHPVGARSPCFWGAVPLGEGETPEQGGSGPGEELLACPPPAEPPRPARNLADLAPVLASPSPPSVPAARAPTRAVGGDHVDREAAAPLPLGLLEWRRSQKMPREPQPLRRHSNLLGGEA